MEHMNIISKEAITCGISWPVTLVGIIAIIAILSCFIYLYIKRDADKTIRLISIVGGIALVIMSITLIISSFFRVPTGRYRYKATIDENQMTVAEYNEFMTAYNHSYCKNGIYHFEDWP